MDLKREYDNKYVEMREASKRLQEQSEHQITLEKYVDIFHSPRIGENDWRMHCLSRSKNQASDDEMIRLKRSLAEWEKRYRDKEQEFFSYKEKQRSAPEVKLQAEINMLTLEKVNLIELFNEKQPLSSILEWTST